MIGEREFLVKRTIGIIAVAVVVIVVASGVLVVPYLTPRPSLVEPAMREGTVNWYGSGTPDWGAKVSEAFKQEYGITVQYTQASDTGVLSRVTSEAATGVNNVDIITVGADVLKELKDKGMLMQYDSPEAKNLDEVARGDAPYMYGVFWGEVLFVYNTKLVSKDELPTSWESLANPAKWTGKFSIADPLIHVTTQQLLYTVYKDWGDARFSTWFKNLVATKPIYQNSLTPVAKVVATGQAYTGLTFYTPLPGLLETRNPIAVQPLDVQYGKINSFAIAAKAPHPNAAKLFIDWMLGKKGMTFASEQGSPTRHDIESRTQLPPGLKFKLFTPISPSEREEFVTKVIKPAMGK